MKRIFTVLDSNHSGCLDESEFKEAMNYINKVMGSPMSDFQIKKLFKVFDLNGDGDVEYSEFVKVLQIVDIEESTKDSFVGVDYGFCESVNPPKWFYFTPEINTLLEKTYQNFPKTKNQGKKKKIIYFNVILFI